MLQSNTKYLNHRRTIWGISYSLNLSFLPLLSSESESMLKIHKKGTIYFCFVKLMNLKKTQFKDFLAGIINLLIFKSIFRKKNVDYRIKNKIYKFHKKYYKLH